MALFYCFSGVATSAHVQRYQTHGCICFFLIAYLMTLFNSTGLSQIDNESFNFDFVLSNWNKEICFGIENICGSSELFLELLKVSLNNQKYFDWITILGNSSTYQKKIEE